MSAGDQACRHRLANPRHQQAHRPGPAGCPASQRIANDPNWGPYLHARSPWLLSSPTKSAATPKVKRRPGRLSRALVPAELDRRRSCGAPPPRSTPPTCDPPGHPTRQRCPTSGNSDSTSDSPPRIPTQTCDGGGYSQKSPAPPRTHSCRNSRKGCTTSPGPASTPPSSCGQRPPWHRLPDDHPAAALWWRILDQLPQTPNQEHATPRRQRPGAEP